eukprot:372692-Pelagomonas_calceolata.AAC.2
MELPAIVNTRAQAAKPLVCPQLMLTTMCVLLFGWHVPIQILKGEAEAAAAEAKANPRGPKSPPPTRSLFTMGKNMVLVLDSASLLYVHVVGAAQVAKRNLKTTSSPIPNRTDGSQGHLDETSAGLRLDGILIFFPHLCTRERGSTGPGCVCVSVCVRAHVTRAMPQESPCCPLCRVPLSGVPQGRFTCWSQPA